MLDSKRGKQEAAPQASDKQATLQEEQQPGTRFPAPRSPHNHELRGYGLFPAAWAVIIQASLVLQGYGSRAAELLCHCAGLCTCSPASGGNIHGCYQLSRR